MQKLAVDTRVLNAQFCSSLPVICIGVVLIAVGIPLTWLDSVLWATIGSVALVLGLLSLAGSIFSLGVLDGARLSEQAIQSEFGLPDIYAVRKRLNRAYLAKQQAEERLGEHISDWAFSHAGEMQARDDANALRSMLADLYSAVDPAQDDWLDPIQSADRQQALNHALAQVRTYLDQGDNDDRDA